MGNCLLLATAVNISVTSLLKLKFGQYLAVGALPIMLNGEHTQPALEQVVKYIQS